MRNRDGSQRPSNCVRRSSAFVRPLRRARVARATRDGGGANGGRNRRLHARATAQGRPSVTTSSSAFCTSRLGGSPEARAALDRVPPSHPAYPMALFKRAQVSALLNEPDLGRAHRPRPPARRRDDERVDRTRKAVPTSQHEAAKHRREAPRSSAGFRVVRVVYSVFRVVRLIRVSVARTGSAPPAGSGADRRTAGPAERRTGHHRLDAVAGLLVEHVVDVAQSAAA